jgi:ribonucleoside-diphosphate reductase alpha chain
MIQSNGSIQTIPEIPDEIKAVYKTVWEMKSSNLIDMAADRGAFICQSQSMNLFLRDVNIGKLNKALFYGWKKGLKTGMYYLRSNAKAQARQSLGEDTSVLNTKEEEVVAIPQVEDIKPQVIAEVASANISDAESEAIQGLNCSLDNPDDCIMCGS